MKSLNPSRLQQLEGKMGTSLPERNCVMIGKSCAAAGCQTTVRLAECPCMHCHTDRTHMQHDSIADRQQNIQASD
jgi:hypothetical protein